MAVVGLRSNVIKLTAHLLWLCMAKRGGYGGSHLYEHHLYAM
jgi:hypothetical protein